jgi:hypothetical protein
MITDQMVEAALQAYVDETGGSGMSTVAMRAALEAAEAAAWQPICDAPCDGTTVLVYAPSPDPQKWHESVHDLPPILCTAAYHEDAGFCIDTIREPTHWRPLPTTPKETT